MDMKTISFIIVALAVTGVFATGQTINSEKSVVTITAYHGDRSSVEATMTGMKGTISFDPEDIESAEFNVCVDPSTFDSDNFIRNWHIKSKQYLGAGKFPEICFVSKQVIEADGVNLATGDLTIHGVTKQASIPFTYSDGVLEGTLEVNRYDYGVGNENEERVAPDIEVQIKCVLE